MEHNTHNNHEHKHSIACGHTKIQHGDHIDYVHHGHLHHIHDDHWDECRIPIDGINPNEENNVNCGCNHGMDCGHEMVQHGDHMDYLVNGRLHHSHAGHCDDHGPVEIVRVG